jgi:hypothetical protein
MPHFSPSGHDMVLCQVCGRDIDTSKEKVVWRPDITGHKSAGNVCAACLSHHGSKSEVMTRGGPISLYEHCKQESGLTNHREIMAYLNRHYGHG